MSRSDRNRGSGWPHATSLVVASMIGVGVFTSAGYQASDLDNAPALLFAWVLGGVAAGCGALAYTELAVAIPQNGGEYALLGRTYHPALGFGAGLVSWVAGFAGPLAASAIAFEQYTRAATGLTLPAGSLAVGLILLATAGTVSPVSARMQQALTLGKIVLVAGVALAGFAGDPSRLLAQPTSFSDAVMQPAFAVGLVYVSYAYTGWNAAVYIAGEVEEPARTLPRALIGGTALVAGLYLAVHVSMLSLAPLSVLAGKVEVADAAFRHGLGPTAASLLSAIIAFGLWSTASAYITTGAAVAGAMGERIPPLAKPHVSTGLIVGLALAMVLTSSFESILSWVGVSLGLFSLLTVLGVYVSRVREPELARPYRAPLIAPALHAVVVLWMIVWVCWESPVLALVGIGTLAASVSVGAMATRRPVP